MMPAAGAGKESSHQESAAGSWLLVSLYPVPAPAMDQYQSNQVRSIRVSQSGNGIVRKVSGFGRHCKNIKSDSDRLIVIELIEKNRQIKFKSNASSRNKFRWYNGTNMYKHSKTLAARLQSSQQPTRLVECITEALPVASLLDDGIRQIIYISDGILTSPDTGRRIRTQST